MSANLVRAIEAAGDRATSVLISAMADSSNSVPITLAPERPRADPIFYKSPVVLLAQQRWAELLPTAGMTPAEQHNATERFILSTASTLFAWTRDSRVIAGALGLTVANILAYKLWRAKEDVVAPLDETDGGADKLEEAARGAGLTLYDPAQDALHPRQNSLLTKPLEQDDPQAAFFGRIRVPVPGARTGH